MVILKPDVPSSHWISRALKSLTFVMGDRGYCHVAKTRADLLQRLGLADVPAGALPDVLGGSQKYEYRYAPPSAGRLEPDAAAGGSHRATLAPPGAGPAS